MFLFADICKVNPNLSAFYKYKDNYWLFPYSGRYYLSVCNSAQYLCGFFS